MVPLSLLTIALCASSADALRGRATKSGTRITHKHRNSRKRKAFTAVVNHEWAKESFPAVVKLSETIKNATCKHEGDAWTKQCYFNTTGCKLSRVEEHKSICTNLIDKNQCQFMSYAITKDHSFDMNLENDYGCKGIALNPSISNPDIPDELPGNATFHFPGSNVTFKKMGAPVLMIGGKAGPNFKVQAPTETRKELKEDRISVLKMDCMGCEYALASTILKDDPKFFHKVDQFALRAHVDEHVMSSQEHLHEYNRLLQLIDEAGLKLMDARFTSCGEDKEWKKFRPPIMGPARKSLFIQSRVHEKCLPELTETGYECSLNCQNFLFARLTPEPKEDENKNPLEKIGEKIGEKVEKFKEELEKADEAKKLKEELEKADEAKKLKDKNQSKTEEVLPVTVQVGKEDQLKMEKK